MSSGPQDGYIIRNREQKAYNKKDIIMKMKLIYAQRIKDSDFKGGEQNARF